MGSHIDTMLNETMRSYLENFFISLQSDSTALNSFLGTLSTFNNTIRTHRDRLQDDTLAAVHNFASVINGVASNVLELETASERLRHDTVSDISRILHEEMGNLTISNERHETSHPSYVEPSYKWLIANLHNPYPSKELKKNISRQTKCSVRDIDSWFIDARKRIGWNSLRKKQFSNKQDKIITAATNFFKPSPLPFAEDLSADLESEAAPNDTYHAEFTAMEDAARSLYSGRFADLSLITPLERPVKELTPETSRTGAERKDAPKRAHSPEPTNSETSVGRKRARSPESRHHDLIFSYPTPEPSPGQSVESSPSPLTPLPLPDLPQTQSSRKRRQSSSERDVEDSLARPQKRFRLDAREFAAIAAVASLPSPANTIDLTEDDPEDSPLPTEPTTSAPLAVVEVLPTKRKRRLSDGDSRRPTKRPHNAMVVPRLQTVSDPFPIAKPAADDSFDDWFQGQFPAEHQLTEAIPSPVNLEFPVSLDAVPLDVDCYQYDFSPYHPEIHLPEAPLLGSVASNPSLSPSEASKPAEIPEKTSDYESLVFSNTVPDFDIAGIAGNFTLDLDFNSIPTYPDIDPLFSFDPQDQILNLDWLDQPAPCSITYYNSPPDVLFDLVQPLPSHSVKTPVLGDFNSTIRQDIPNLEEQDAKRLRAQQLREELRRLEAEITV